MSLSRTPCNSRIIHQLHHLPFAGNTLGERPTTTLLETPASNKRTLNKLTSPTRQRHSSGSPISPKPPLAPSQMSLVPRRRATTTELMTTQRDQHLVLLLMATIFNCTDTMQVDRLAGFWAKAQSTV